MRAIAVHRPRVLALLALAALMLGGCARRFALTPDELNRVNVKEGDANPLRVYTHRKLISLYDESNADEQYDVQGQIRESTEKGRIKEVINRNAPGLILRQEELNGATLLWVSFEPSCTQPGCAFGFVETEDKNYRLVSVPPIAEHKPPRSFRACVWKKRRLKKGKLASLAEANEVYLVKKGNGKVLTIDLDIKKVVDDRTKTRVRRQRGIRFK